MSGILTTDRQSLEQGVRLDFRSFYLRVFMPFYVIMNKVFLLVALNILYEV